MENWVSSVHGIIGLSVHIPNLQAAAITGQVPACFSVVVVLPIKVSSRLDNGSDGLEIQLFVNLCGYQPDEWKDQQGPRSPYLRYS